MSQANDSHSTTPPGSCAGIAVSSKTYHGVTRSQIMKRAWQPAKLNHDNIHSSIRDQLGRWISHPCRGGQTENLTFLFAEHEARSLTLGGGTEHAARNCG